MSCEDDDYGWDDPEPIIETVIRQIEINNVKACDIQIFEKGLISCIEQKLEKLNVIAKQMNVYVVKDHIIINDRYSICPEFNSIVESFGMSIRQITIPSLRGKTYLISDEIVAILHKISSNYCFGKSIGNMNANEAIRFEAEKNKIKYHRIEEKYDNELTGYIKQILCAGTVFVEEKETLIDGVSQGIESNKDSVEDKLSDLLGEIEQQVENIQNQK